MPSPSLTRARSVGPIEPPSPAEVAEFFPHLEVLELIGAGGMGAVYKARQPHLDRLVALKIVQSPRGDTDPVFAERFAREARAMAKLDHPNIVTIHESGEAGGLPFLVMEYVDGITLREAMANGVLTAVEALAVIPQVCDALEYAHASGVVHRDIKPENILLDQTGRVKIADFGLAKLADPKNVTLTRTQQAMGTPHYMAPEQWERPTEVDHRADIYALGVVLYELLTGELPLGRFELPSQKGKGDARLDAVVVRALAKEPGQRYQRAGELKNELSGVRWSPTFGAKVAPRRRGYEFKSKATFLGWPLVHVAAGFDPVSGRKRIARGWIAVGDVMAVGGVAVSGVMSVGVVALSGVLGLGLLAVGGALAVGLLAAVGGNAAALLFALGGNAASTGLSIGGLAAGKFAIGGEAAGEFVISDRGQTPGFGDALWAWVKGFGPF
jgi:tRNA A-37 threonylcarbamoyl transferase component Bud32